MYHKILVAVDRSPISEKVFETGLTLAKALNSQLMLVHVLSSESQDRPIDYSPYSASYDVERLEAYKIKWQIFRQESLKLLQKWSEQANAQSVKTEFTQLTGNPGSSILSLSQDWGAELIIMGRRGKSTLKEIFLGSVSSYIIHRSHCAVHLVQN